MTIPVVLFTLLSCITAVVLPWLGVVIYYVNSVGQLGSLWPHHFGESRVSLYMSLAILVGLVLATATRQVNYKRLFILPNLLLLLVVVMFNLAIEHSPYEGFEEIKRSALSPLEMLDTFNKIVLIYFVSVLLIDTRFKLLVLITAIGGVLLYYTAWANKIYVTGEFWRFGDNGRLNGPLGLYYDENYMAMIFLLATPVFYYLSVGTTSRIIRYGLWICIPASWHALFLTGSRGALLALGIVCAYIFFRSYNKWASVILVVGLAVAIIDQSGNMISRINTTVVSNEEVERDRAFIENTEDSPEITGKALDPRLISWKVGLSIMQDHPLLGVGAGNFLRAFPDYHESEPHVAHNTFIQFGATCGIGASLVYLYFLFLRLRNIATRPDPEKKYAHGYNRDYLDDLLNSLFLAFYTVAFFLDLMIIEVTYFVFLIGVCKYYLDQKRSRSVWSLIESIYRWKQGGAAEDEAPVVAAPVIVEEEPVTSVPSIHAPASGEVPRNQYAGNNQYAG